MDNWYRIKDKEPEVAEEVQVYNKYNIHEEYCPTGVTNGFMMDDKSFCLAIWNNEYDYWDAVNIAPNSPNYPTHWQPKATAPKD